MTDEKLLPEEIWAYYLEYGTGTWIDFDDSAPEDPATRYVRADLIETPDEALDKAITEYGCMLLNAGYEEAANYMLDNTPGTPIEEAQPCPVSSSEALEAFERIVRVFNLTGDGRHSYMKEVNAIRQALQRKVPVDVEAIIEAICYAPPPVFGQAFRQLKKMQSQGLISGHDNRDETIRELRERLEYIKHEATGTYGPDEQEKILHLSEEALKTTENLKE